MLVINTMVFLITASPEFILMTEILTPAKCGRIKRNRLKGNSGEDNCRNF